MNTNPTDQPAGTFPPDEKYTPSIATGSSALDDPRRVPVESGPATTGANRFDKAAMEAAKALQELFSIQREIPDAIPQQYPPDYVDVEDSDIATIITRIAQTPLVAEMERLKREMGDRTEQPLRPPNVTITSAKPALINGGTLNAQRCQSATSRMNGRLLCPNNIQYPPAG